MKKIALSYLKRGWSIIPIKTGSKLPAIPSWTKYQTQLPSEKEVTDWWTRYPNANIALVCGEISGVIVVDIDSGHGTPDTKGLHLPVTLSSKTGGGGRHLIYKWRKGLVGAKVGIRKLVDIRSDNSYIVLPPSLHQSGNLYEWSTDDKEIIEDAPEWLQLSETPDVKNDWDKFFKEDKGKGVRNMSASKVAGKILFDMSVDTWDTLGVMAFRAWNRECNTPPLDDKELMSVWNSIKKKHIKNNKPPEITPEQEEEPSDDEVTEQAIVKLFQKNKTEGTYLLAKYIVERYNIITIGEKEREMFIYQGGIYRSGADNLVIFPEIQRILRQYVNKNSKTETYHKICDMTAHPRTIFTEVDTRYIPLKNGVYDLNTNTLLPHSPDYKFTHQLPVLYDPEATCPKTLAFFSQILNPEQQKTVEEWLGYYILRNYIYKKAIVFVGDGDTGKTTLLEVIISLIGRENISAVSLQKMTGDKFSAAHMYQKHGNIVDELSAKDISDTDAFKMATGGGSISGEYKFGNQFSFLNYAKLTFACNRIPDVKDTNDDAYFNRWIIVRFENTLTEKIPNFIATMTTEEERSGLFNIALRGLQRLTVNRKFTYGSNAEETKMEMLRSGSSIAMFVSDMLIQKDSATISKDDLYDAYTKYCTDNKMATQTKDMIGKKLTGYAPYIVDGLIDGYNQRGRVDRVRGWRNVAIKEEVQTDFSDISKGYELSPEE